jgi:hypothetical protein
LRGRIEKVLDAAKVKGFRQGENPARWRQHVDHLLPRQPKLRRGHHAAMPYEEVASFIAKLRERDSLTAQALELCILTAARSGEILGMRWDEVDLESKLWMVPAHRMNRSSFRDWAGNETSFPREVVEPALAHVIGNEAEQAYRRSDALDKRRKLMEAWAGFVNSSEAQRFCAWPLIEMGKP